MNALVYCLLFFLDYLLARFLKSFAHFERPGQPIDIATRHYDEPGVERVYYRLWRERGTILSSPPYALNSLDKIYLIIFSR
jgi:hypothetical protein